MKKKTFFVFYIFVLFLIAELIIRLAGNDPFTAPNFYTKPYSFFSQSDLIGWKVKSNDYFKTHINKKNAFRDRADSLGNRKTESRLLKLTKKPKKINLYGCSYTYGVSDKENMGFYLQEKLINEKITNRDVPAFGLYQMFLLLKMDLINKRTPTVAIFNYATFHDSRTPLVYSYQRHISFDNNQFHRKDENKKINLPI